MSNLAVYDGLNVTTVNQLLSSVKRSAASDATSTLYYGTKETGVHYDSAQQIQRFNSINPLTPQNSLYYINTVTAPNIKTTGGYTYFSDNSEFGIIDENHVRQVLLTVDGSISDFTYVDGGSDIVVYGSFTTVYWGENLAQQTETGSVFLTNQTGVVTPSDYTFTGNIYALEFLLVLPDIICMYVFGDNVDVSNSSLGPFKAAMYNGTDWVFMDALQDNPDIYSVWFTPDYANNVMYIGSLNGAASIPSLVWTDIGTGTLSVLGNMTADGFSHLIEGEFLYTLEAILLDEILYVSIPYCIKNSDTDYKTPILKYENNIWQEVGDNTLYYTISKLIVFQNNLYGSGEILDQFRPYFITLNQTQWETVLSTNENSYIGYIESLYTHNDQLYLSGEPLRGNNDLQVAKLTTSTSLGNAIINYNTRTLQGTGTIQYQVHSVIDNENKLYSVGSIFNGDWEIAVSYAVDYTEINSKIPLFDYDNTQMTGIIGVVTDVQINSNNEMFLLYTNNDGVSLIGRYDWNTNEIINYLPNDTSANCSNIVFDNDDNIIFAGVYTTDVSTTPVDTVGVFSLAGNLEQTVFEYGDLSNFDLLQSSIGYIRFDSNYVLYSVGNYYNTVDSNNFSLIKVSSENGVWENATNVANGGSFIPYSIVVDDSNIVYYSGNDGTYDQTFVYKVVNEIQTTLSTTSELQNIWILASKDNQVYAAGQLGNDTELSKVVGNNVQKVATITTQNVNEISSIVIHSNYGILCFNRYNTDIYQVVDILSPGTFVGDIEDIAIYNNSIYILTSYGGIISTLEAWQELSGIYQYNISSNQWMYHTYLSFDPNYDCKFFSNTNLYIGGEFSEIGNVSLNSFAVLQGNQWVMVGDDSILQERTVTGITNFGNTLYVSKLDTGEG